MRRIITIRRGDQEYKAIEQDFEIGREDWSVYKLLDGGVVRLKTTVSTILRIVDDEGRPKYNPDGTPSYIVKHKSDVVASG